jgi:hypothetical protein
MKSGIFRMRLGLAGLAGLALAGWVLFVRPPQQPVLPPLEEHQERLPAPQLSDVLKIGYGWSEEPSVSQATEAALAMLAKHVPQPKFILVFFTNPYDPHLIRDGIVKTFGQAKILGMQSGEGVFSPDGVHSSPTGALAMLGFQAEQFSVGIAGAPADGDSNHEQVAKQVVAAALKDAGKTAGEPPGGMITGQVLGASEIYSDVLNQQLPGIPMIGGNQITSKIALGAIIANRDVYPSGFVLGLFYYARPIGTYFHGGFVARTKSGTVTQVAPENSHVIVEIDHRPAVTVYNEWANDDFRQYLGKAEPVIVNASVTQPLAKALNLADGSIQYVTLHPWKFNPDGSFDGGVAVSVGERIHYMRGNEQILIKRSGVVARKAMIEGGFPIRQLAGGIHIYCIGAGMKLGINQTGLTPAMVREIKANTAGAPFIGGFFGGEQGRIKGYGYFAGNLMSSMMVFSK